MILSAGRAKKMGDMKVTTIFTHGRKCFLAAGLVGFGFLFTGCARVSTETGYVFDAEDAADNITLKDNLCKDVHAYKGQTPTYFAKYSPDANLGVRLQLLAPRKRHNLGFGPGVILPMPLIPNPWGNASAAYYHSSPTKDFSRFIVAVYPDAFKQNYFFTPSRVSLEIGGKVMAPVRVTRHYTVNLDPRKQEYGVERERLKVRNGEFDTFVIEFDVGGMASADAILHMSGFDHNGVGLNSRDYPLTIKQSTAFDWQHDVDCQD